MPIARPPDLIDAHREIENPPSAFLAERLDLQSRYTGRLMSVATFRATRPRRTAILSASIEPVTSEPRNDPPPAARRGCTTVNSAGSCLGTPLVRGVPKQLIQTTNYGVTVPRCSGVMTGLPQSSVSVPTVLVVPE